MSPLSLVRFAGRPAGRACWKISICPALAASYILVAMAMTSGGTVEESSAILLIGLENFGWNIKRRSVSKVRSGTSS